MEDHSKTGTTIAKYKNEFDDLRSFYVRYYARYPKMYWTIFLFAFFLLLGLLVIIGWWLSNMTASLFTFFVFVLVWFGQAKGHPVQQIHRGIAETVARMKWEEDVLGFFRGRKSICIDNDSFVVECEYAKLFIDKEKIVAVDIESFIVITSCEPLPIIIPKRFILNRQTR